MENGRAGAYGYRSTPRSPRDRGSALESWLGFGPIVAILIVLASYFLAYYSDRQTFWTCYEKSNIVNAFDALRCVNMNGPIDRVFTSLKNSRVVYDKVWYCAEKVLSKEIGVATARIIYVVLPLMVAFNIVRLLVKLPYLVAIFARLFKAVVVG